MELGPAPQSPPVPLGVAKSLLPAKSPASDTQSPSRSRNGTRSRRGSSGSTQRDVLFSQPAGVRRSPNVRRSAGGRGSQSSEQINVSKLTQEIFRKRIGAGGKRPRKKYEQKQLDFNRNKVPACPSLSLSLSVLLFCCLSNPLVR